MMFAQPGILWALPAVAVPLIIHLLNRLRYRPVRWAATMFIAEASRSFPRRARWRHYLILAARMLAVLLLILAMSRPRAGGLASRFGASGPDAVILLLDRSPSMERLDAGMESTRRQRAMRAVSSAARALRGTRRFIVPDQAGRPVEFADISAFERSSFAAATDAGFNLPGMLRWALDAVSRERGENFEIWIASDFQTASWRPDSPDWTILAGRMAGMSGRVRVMIFDTGAEEAPNSSVRVLEAGRRRRFDGATEVSALLEIRAEPTGADYPMTMPVTATMGGVRLQTTFELAGAVSRHRWNLEAPDSAASGWIRVEIPPDGNARDNVSWGVWGPERAMRTLVAAEDRVFGRTVAKAAAPDESGRWAAEVRDPRNIGASDLSEVSLVVWQAGRPEAAVEAALESFVRQGGVLLGFPPSGADGEGPLGIRWKQEEECPASHPWTVPVWEENEGPLAKAESGRSLPVGRVLTRKRRAIAAAGSTGMRGDAWSVFAAFDDGQALLERRILGAGSVWACASLPVAGWSDLADGRVIVPMIQRLARGGSLRMSRHRMVECGTWKPEPGSPAPAARDSLEKNPDPVLHAGVYETGDATVAVVRPAAEDDPSAISAEEARSLLGDVPVRVARADSVLKADSSGTELWPMLVALALAAMVAESWLVNGSAGNRLK